MLRQSLDFPLLALYLKSAHQQPGHPTSDIVLALQSDSSDSSPDSLARLNLAGSSHATVPATTPTPRFCL